jgi:hypothetical protein
MLTLFSCSKENSKEVQSEITNQQKNKRIVTSTFQNQEVIRKALAFRSSLSSQLESEDPLNFPDNLTFDTTYFDMAQLEGVSEYGLIMNTIDFEETSDLTYHHVFFTNETSEIESSYFMSCHVLSSGTREIIYYNDLDYTPLLKVILDPEDESMTFINYENMYGMMARPCGQATMDCINDAYTNHGWVSVWAWVQTAYIPATGVAIAAACAGRNCL